MPMMVRSVIIISSISSVVEDVQLHFSRFPHVCLHNPNHLRHVVQKSALATRSLCFPLDSPSSSCATQIGSFVNLGIGQKVLVHYCKRIDMMVLRVLASALMT